MAEIPGGIAKAVVVDLPESVLVDTNDAVRQRVSRLIELGVSQKVLARKMGLTTSWFSRWVNQKKPLVIPVSAMDGFTRYLKELAEAVHDAADLAPPPSGSSDDGDIPHQPPGRTALAPAIGGGGLHMRSR